MEKNETPKETVADIIAEMRMGNAGDFPFAYMIGDPDTPEVIDFTTKKVVEPRKINIRRVTVSNLADRLEAAWKREREELERYATSKMLDGATIVDNRKGGDAAAMRDAVETALTTIRGVINGTIARTNNSVFDCRDRLKASLAAPARNCDVHTGWLTALKKFNDTDGKRKPWGDDVFDTRFLDWLFAPAAERKGESDGR